LERKFHRHQKIKSGNLAEQTAGIYLKTIVGPSATKVNPNKAWREDKYEAIKRQLQ